MLARLKEIVRHRVTRHFGVPEIPLALERLRNNNFSPTHIFDVGAYSGQFAKLCRNVWPNAKLTCFEVLPDRVKELRAWSTNDGNSEIVECLLGAQVRSAVAFHEMETASSVLEEHIPQSAPIRFYPMKTIDEVVAVSTMPPPTFLKLDVQGYEFEVLNGAKQTLPSVAAILTEVNLIDIHKGVHLLDELILLLRDNGFLAYDICGLARRPLDAALWQADFIFVPKDSFLRVDKRWQP